MADLSAGRGGAGDHLPLPAADQGVPSPLVTIIVLTALTVWFGWDVRTVGDMGELPDTLPMFLIPDIPLTWRRCRSSCPIPSRSPSSACWKA
jgi:MFS superfamily sulfate permease-like transporter